MTDTTEVAEDTTETDVTEHQDDTTEDWQLDPATAENLAKVRREAKNLRDRAKTAEARVDELARALFAERVAATGLVENPAEITFDADALDDADALADLIGAAIGERPYIRARKFGGDAGQGQRGNNAGPVDFSALFR